MHCWPRKKFHRNILVELRFVILLIVSQVKFNNLYAVLYRWIYVWIDHETKYRSYYVMIVRREEMLPSIGCITNARIAGHTTPGFFECIQL